MLCRKVLELLPRFIENDFSPEETAEIHGHIESCDRCRAEYESMRSLADRLDSFPVVGVPDSFKQAIMHRLPDASDGDGEADP